jgi:hypothetical protein
MSEPETAGHYTVEEANALLPELREALARIRENRQTVLAGAERIRASAPHNGSATPGNAYWDALGALRRDVDDLNARDLILRDPETGLIDFPSERDGQEVLLCWRLEEEHVGFWHGPGTGFAGRRPL